MNSPIRIKTFRSKTLQEAFQQIRSEFGPGASILETKAARFGIFGRTRIEVTASSNTHNFSLEDTDPIAIDSVGSRDASQHFDSFEINCSADLDTDNDLGVVESHMQSAMEVAKPDRVLGQVLQELVEAGIDTGIAQQWIEASRVSSDSSVKQDVWKLRSEILGWIRDLVHAAPPMPLDHPKQQVIALVGPAGAGKTSSLAKIAASLSMERGLSVGVLSMDSVRTGSNQLLQNYAEVLGWQFEVANSLEQVSSCMEGLSNCRFVLIDTCGCSPADNESLDELRRLIAIAKPTETHLVISSTSNTRSFLRYEQSFELLKPNRLILTRLDESGGLGSFFSCLQSCSLPVSYLTNGRNIPQDLIQATELRIAQHIMALAD